MRLILLAALLLAGNAAAQEATLGAITVEHPWTRPARSGDGIAYMTIQNRGSSPDRLTGASSEVARAAELHAHTVDGEGIARMRGVQGIEIPPGGRIELGPSGLAVMLIGLKRPLEAEQSFPVVLTFEKAGSLSVNVAVEKRPGAAGASPAPHHMEGMK